MRFYKPGQTQYQSQFAPLNLDFMQKNLAQKEANDLVAEDLLDKASQLQVKGGNYTDPAEAKQYNDWIQSNTAAVRDKFYAGELDAKEAARNLSKISQFYNTNEVVKRINNDYLYSQSQNKAIAEGKLKNGLGTNFSYLGDTPEFRKVSMKNLTDDQHAALYNTVTPSDIYAKENYGERLKDLKADVDSYDWSTLPKAKNIGGVDFYTTQNGIKTKEELTRDMVYNKALQFSDEELANASAPYVQYNKIKYGDQFNREKLASDIADAYMGTYKKDITKIDNNYSQATKSGKVENPPPAPGYYNTSVTEVKNPLGDLKNLNFRQPSSKSNYIVDKDDTPANKKFMREQNKIKNQGGYASFDELSSAQQKMLVKVITRAGDQEALNLLNSGKELPDALKGKYYAEVKRYSSKINPDEVRLVNNTAIPLSTEEIKTTNNELFGNPNGVKLNALGTAIGAGMLYMDESGKEYKLNDLIGLHGEGSTIKVTSKSDNKNALNIIGGTQDYTNALHVNIEGKRYYTQGKNYSPGTPEYSIQENNKVINKAFNAKISGMEEYIPIDGNSQILIEPSGNKVQVRIIDMKGNVIKSYGEAVNVDQTPTAIQQLLNY